MLDRLAGTLAKLREQAVLLCRAAANWLRRHQNWLWSVLLAVLTGAYVYTLLSSSVTRR